MLEVDCGGGSVASVGTSVGVEVVGSVVVGAAVGTSVGMEVVGSVVVGA